MYQAQKPLSENIRLHIFMAFASIYLVFFVLERVLYLYPFKRIPSSYFSIIEWENLVSLSVVVVAVALVLQSVLFKRRLSLLAQLLGGIPPLVVGLRMGHTELARRFKSASRDAEPSSFEFWFEVVKDSFTIYFELGYAVCLVGIGVVILSSIHPPWIEEREPVVERTYLWNRKY